MTEPRGYWLGDARGEVPETLSGGRVVDLKALRTAISRGALLIDVSRLQHRPDALPAGALWMPAPHAVIPRTHWWAGAGEGNLSAAEGDAFRLQLKAITHADKRRALIFYCHEHCWLSWNAAKRAINDGYTEVRWYPEGIEGWTRAGLPTEPAAAEPWASGAP